MVKEPKTITDTPEPQAVTPFTVNAASVGTALVAVAGTISAFTLTQPGPTAIDDSTQLVLVDAAAAPTPISPPPRTLFAASLRALACLNEPRPGVGLTPGMTAPAWPKSLSSIAIPFSNGCFVKSCPANLTFTVSI
jgi:hypothetical protein